jgi:hypothetical protein
LHLHCAESCEGQARNRVSVLGHDRVACEGSVLHALGARAQDGSLRHGDSLGSRTPSGTTPRARCSFPSTMASDQTPVHHPRQAPPFAPLRGPSRANSRPPRGAESVCTRGSGPATASVYTRAPRLTCHAPLSLTLAPVLCHWPLPDAAEPRTSRRAGVRARAI